MKKSYAAVLSSVKNPTASPVESWDVFRIHHHSPASIFYSPACTAAVLFFKFPGVLSTGRPNWREHTFPVCPSMSAAARARVTLLSPNYSQEKQMTSFLKFGIQGEKKKKRIKDKEKNLSKFAPSLDRNRSINVSLLVWANCSFDGFHVSGYPLII